MEERNESLAVKPKKAFEMLGLGRSLGYLLLQSGEIKSIRVGRAILVPVAALHEWLTKKTTESGDIQGDQRQSNGN